jgi:hypothetical protein
MIDPAVGALLAGAFALLFASAALHKYAHPAHFAAVFAAYRILPAALTPLSRLVWLLELTVSAALLVRGARLGAAAAGICLLLLYALAIGINLARGRRDLDCGCTGPNERRPIAPWMVTRNLLLALGLSALLLPWGTRVMTATDALTVGTGTAVAALLYMSLDTLLVRVTPRTAAGRGMS